MTDKDHDCWDPTQLRPTISFEVMPPRRPDIAPNFWSNVDRLIGARPDFLSVTYGAAGTDRQTARQVVSRLIGSAPLLPIAHLTCVGHSRADVVEVVDEFLSAGVRSFLALRGDPPAGQPDWQPTPGGVNSSVELIALLRDRERVRCAAHPGNALRGAAQPLTIAVATFPGGNPSAGTSSDQEIERLLVKQAAGANFAITQLFYRPETYADFVDRARAAGVHLPILAGIIPSTDPARLHRVAELTGLQPPPELLKTLAEASSDEARHEAGVRATTDLARAVLDAGAPGLHIYTFNKATPALDVLSGLGLTTDTTTTSTPTEPVTAPAVVKG
ncbi:methylenetetrahydrofolate reductase [Rarobacter faecitabidus]|uniref:Methylenetetrahydrofolate reductase n=1 Tax=Rarobacter faecitabidus TaxID=13243 RepID=A0A542ZA70_RARFA|nr:methylenetetrahydrofolate reductase [Rarobacter faecitabidus]TQL57215.1 methylenetetrahydrofolate reductase (NADPH) [Rarobacter faecitabidus]